MTEILTSSSNRNLTVNRLLAFSVDDWASIASAFAPALSCELGQSWSAQPEPDFAAATVRAGWRDNALWVYAVLSDADIYNPHTVHNEFSFNSGDVFEIFLRPEGQEAYVEYHVAPTNQRLHLRFPYDGSADQIDVATLLQDPSSIESWVSVEPNASLWRVLARVPAGAVSEKGRIEPGDAWAFSFCRYDYTKGRAEPVLSSTSAFTKVFFHALSEWDILQFA